LGLWVAAICCIVTTIARAGSADSPHITYHSGVAEVRLTFSATDQTGQPLSTLDEHDFAVVDGEDVVRNFQSFGRTPEASLDLAVLVDASESVKPHFRQETADGLQLISHLTMIPHRQLSVISFRGLTPVVLCATGCTPSTTAKQLASLEAGGATPLFDAVFFAADLMSEHAMTDAKRVLIVFSDGEDTISRHSVTDAIAHALERDIQICVVDLSPSGHSAEGTFFLQKLANDTGGLYFASAADAARALDVALADFRTTYTVTYKVPGHAPGFHPVRILPTHDLRLQFHCRSGYEYSGKE